MFVRYYLDIAAPAADVEMRLFEDPQAWVPGLLRAAEDRGRTLLAEVGFELESRRIAKEVEIFFGSPFRFPSKTVLPMTWRAAGHAWLFPRLEADLEVAPLGVDRTQLSMSASYRPPMGTMGRALDRALLHRVAEATVKDFLDGVGAQLSHEPAIAGR